MRFCYDWNEPELAHARLDRELRQIVEDSSRVARQRASRTLLLVVPLLIALLAGSYAVLGRRDVSGGWSVLGVAVLGALLAGVLVLLRRVAPLTHRRPSASADPPGLPLLLATLLASAAAGTCSGLLIDIASDAGAYRPQTVYLIAFVTSIVWSRFTAVSTPSTGPR